MPLNPHQHRPLLAVLCSQCFPWAHFAIYPTTTPSCLLFVPSLNAPQPASYRKPVSRNLQKLLLPFGTLTRKWKTVSIKAPGGSGCDQIAGWLTRRFQTLRTLPVRIDYSLELTPRKQGWLQIPDVGVQSNSSSFTTTRLTLIASLFPASMYVSMR